MVDLEKEYQRKLLRATLPGEVVAFAVGRRIESRIESRKRGLSFAGWVGGSVALVVVVVAALATI